MKKISRRSFLTASGLLAASAALTACGGSSASGNTASSASTVATGKHEPITMMLPFKNITEFMKAFSAKYPEINLEIIPYTGQNTTALVQDQMIAGELPDIYFTTAYAPGTAHITENLMDLSGYGFTDNYSESFLRSVRDDGGVYLLPAYYNAMGITYNKKIFEQNGWELPTSMADMDVLAEKAKATDYDLSLVQLDLPGYGFQYFFNVASAGWLSTLDGLQWQADFLHSDATVAGSPDMQECAKQFEHYYKLGLLNGNRADAGLSDVAHEMQEGNTLFMFGASNNFFTDEENKDTFGLLPFLSEDGKHNVFISNVGRYFGLNAKLQEAGNEQKLEDALTFMEYISTAEGMNLLSNAPSSNSILPMKDYIAPEGSLFLEIKDQLDSGMVAPLILGGNWANLIVPIGNEVISYLRGNATMDDVLKTIDDGKSLMETAGDVCTTVIETLDTDTCIQWVGIAYTQATGADVALLSKNKYYMLDDYQMLNNAGINGCMYPLPVTDQEITAVIPQGWTGKLETTTLTGKEINDLLESGYDKDGTGEHNYPYTLVAKEGFTLEDDKAYTVVYCGLSDAMKESHEVVDTEILGLDAARSYLSQFETFSAKDIQWQ